MYDEENDDNEDEFEMGGKMDLDPMGDDEDSDDPEDRYR